MCSFLRCKGAKSSVSGLRIALHWVCQSELISLLTKQALLARGFATGLMFRLVSVSPNYMFLSGKNRGLLVFHLFTCFTLFWFQFVDFSALLHILVLNILCLNIDGL